MSSALERSIDYLVSEGLQHRILLPDDPEYATRNDSYWSNSSKLKPAYILQPHAASEVSIAVNALVASGQRFAVRSGGCNFWPSNNIDGGVTIDLGHMNSVEYNSEDETVSIGPGARWGEVSGSTIETDSTVICSF